MSKTHQKKYSPEVKARAVRLVQDSLDEHPSEWAAIKSISSKIGCTAESLRTWVRGAQQAKSPTSSSHQADLERITELEREVRELRRANEILKKASAFFAQAELDRRP